MEREINSSKLADHGLTDGELNLVAGGGLYEAFMCFLHGGVDASHKTDRREGGGPRGA